MNLHLITSAARNEYFARYGKLSRKAIRENFNIRAEKGKYSISGDLLPCYRIYKNNEFICIASKDESFEQWSAFVNINSDFITHTETLREMLEFFALQVFSADVYGITPEPTGITEIEETEEADYYPLISDNFKAMGTGEKLETVELVLKLADKLNLDASDLKMHEAINLFYKASEAVYKCLDTLEADRKHLAEILSESE